MKRIFGCAGDCRGFLCAQAVFVVFKRYDFVVALSLDLFELFAVLPFVFPCTVIYWVANGVILDGHTVMGCQLVFPSCISVSIGVAFCWCQRTDTAGRVGIRFLCLDVPAEIIGVNPGRTGGSRRSVCRIVNAGQLADGVILVRDACAAVDNLCNAAAVIIAVLQGNAMR